MNKNITDYALTRYTSKAFDKTKKISKDNIEKVKELLRYSASSVNSQPWHFIIASTDEAKKKIAKSAEEKYPFNSNSILNASHVVVFCTKKDINEEYISKLVDKEDADNRFPNEEFKQKQLAGKTFFINMHRHEIKDVKHWMDKQVYLNLGSFLLGVSTLNIDATPMEGIDFDVIDKEFELSEKGFSSTIVVPIGYHDEENDFNAKLPKSRLDAKEIFTEV